MSNPWFHTLGVFDLETTGIDVTTSRIVSAHVGVIGPGGEVLEQTDWLADPGIEIQNRPAPFTESRQRRRERRAGRRPRWSPRSLRRCLISSPAVSR